MTYEQIEVTLQRNADNLGGGFDGEVLGYINRFKEQLYKTEQKLAECEVGYQATLDLERRMRADEKEQNSKDTAKEILTQISKLYLRDSLKYSDIIYLCNKYGVEVDE